MREKGPAAAALLAAIVLGLSASPALGVEGQQPPAPDRIRAGETPVGGLIRIPVELRRIHEFIAMATGLSNVYLITTTEGNVLVDTGFGPQAPRQHELLREVSDAPVRYLFLPQGQQDDIGGVHLWKGPETRILMTRSTARYMPWRKRMAPFLALRFARLYNWAPRPGSAAPALPPFEPIAPDILVDDEEGYRFELGGVRFEVMALPGAEGRNSAGLWLPDQRILLCGGGFVGPAFPSWPNIGTVRADRGRSLDAYIESLERVIALEPRMLLTGQNEPVLEAEAVRRGLEKLLRATTAVRDAVVEGLNAGKDVHQLMQEIRLPPEVADLSQNHGRVDWTIRSVVNEYGAWFQYRDTTELYPLPIRSVYPDLVDLAGGTEPLIRRARRHLAEGRPVQAMFLVEVALGADPPDRAVLEAQRDVLGELLRRARAGTRTFSEIAWLEAEIERLEGELAETR